MPITWARTWPDRRDARRDYVAKDDGVSVGRVYFVEIATGPAWFWAANGIQAAPGTVGCALSGHEATKQEAAERVKAAWSMWLDSRALGGDDPARSLGRASEPQMTFLEYLRTLKQPDSPRGDFIGDVLRDNTFPPAVISSDSLAGYLAAKGAADDVIRIGRSLWREYEKSEQTPASAV